MDAQILFQASLIAAFLGGMIALFAPCCISFLLPAYLGSVFKERRWVLMMTMVFSLGIFVVMLPAVLGAQALSLWLFRYHEATYITGGAIMILVGFISFLGIKLPMPTFARQNPDHPDVISIFMLGIFSGLTSACCAPVLVGVLTLSFLTPSFWQALLIGAVYVLGMVFPLYIGAYFLDYKKVLGWQFFRRQLTTLKIGKAAFKITTASLISGLIFIPMGIAVVLLALYTEMSMQSMAEGFAKFVQDLTYQISEYSKLIPGSEIIFFILIVLGVVLIIKRTKQEYARHQKPCKTEPKMDNNHCCHNS
ncbi:MAG: hypothetical protein A2788_01930 [Candidatus Abawacabacteria bacterium RIFCSPHIGHO2_01_FULL_46_8]|uniref:Uncharacterized protein n=1 Tax=Candidatus Abawacabacteria bacterium RIFCSPHIGHO2_01_FULL_46_8 TaxID=1817815 RepID=A0A1F4XJQ6_9BACT|nr:MAG: hypothetical protein A2788_01930 [Candidatus Abawacabacteria bacterium RIFCSPHIGHO2_01_FULL_46_8]